VSAAVPLSEEVFEAHRRLLFGVAYRMLGSVAEAEDAVQETFLRAARDGEAAANPRAFLVTVVARICLDVLKSARVNREQYIGPWLPEPLLSRPGEQPALDDGPLMEDSISTAFLVMLEELAPVERAVFLLREVFDYDYGDIAPIVAKSETNCRQVFRRARERIAERRHRFNADSAQRRELTMRFIAAAGEGNMAALIEMLSSDAIAYADGGGKVVAALKPVVGADHVAKYILGVTRKDPPRWVELVDVNGSPGVLFRDAHGVTNITSFEVAEGQITAIYVLRNPDKLRHIQVPR